jgi:SpoIIAA-like
MPPETKLTLFDDVAWPFVVVRWPSQPLSDAEFSAAMAQIAKYFERGERFGLVMDISVAPMLSAERRRDVAEQMDENQRRYLGRLVGIALVTSSSFHRGIMNAINWLRQQQEPPTQAFEDVSAALAWLRQKYRAAIA